MSGKTKKAGDSARCLLVGVLGVLGMMLPGGYAEALQPEGDVFVETQVKAFAAVAVTNSGDFAALAELGTPQGGSNAALVFLNTARKITAIVPVKPPRDTTDLKFETLSPKSLTPLNDGGFLITGGVGVRPAKAGSPASGQALGWAARTDWRGQTIWSRAWRETGDTKVQETFYFGRIVSDKKVLVGGSRQTGAGCKDSSNGVLLWVEIETGNIVQPRIQYDGGAVRQGFRDASILSDGTVVVTGWLNEKAQGAACPSNVWVGRANSKGEDFANRHFGGPGKDAGVAIGNLDDAAVQISAVSHTDGGVETGVTYWMLPDSKLTLLARKNIPRAESSRLFASSPLLKKGMLEVGSVELQGTERGLVRIIGPHGECFASAEYAPPRLRFKTSQATGAAFSEKGGLIVVGNTIGKSSNAEAQVGWVAWLSPSAAASQHERDLNWGTFAAGESKISVIEATKDNTQKYYFNLQQSQKVNLAFHSIKGDIDVILSDSNGRIVDVSDNGGLSPELIRAELNPGRYTVAVSTSTASALYIISASNDAGASASTSTIPIVDLENKLRRQLILKELSTLGYLDLTGMEQETSDIEVGFSLRIKHLASAFQASNCLPQTGVLPPDQMSLLAEQAARKTALAGLRQATSAQRELKKTGLKKGEVLFGSKSRPFDIAFSKPGQVGYSRVEFNDDVHFVGEMTCHTFKAEKCTVMMNKLTASGIFKNNKDQFIGNWIAYNADDLVGKVDEQGNVFHGEVQGNATKFFSGRNHFGLSIDQNGTTKQVGTWDAPLQNCAAHSDADLGLLIKCAEPKKEADKSLESKTVE